MQVKSVIADFKGTNQEFKKYIANEKRSIVTPDFKEVLAVAVKREG